jgi:outer membrane protein assembly factor BamB
MLRASLAFAFLAAPVFAADPPTWPQWRGPTRDGIVPADAKKWPDKLAGDALTQTWQVKDLGPSYSGPIVSADTVFTTETRDKKTEWVTAFDRKTGKKKWETSWTGSLTVPFFAAKNGSWIRSTPAFDGDRLYVCGIRDLLVCLDAKTGKELWQVDFAAAYKTDAPTFGAVCSPLVDDTGVYIQAGGRFVKLDKKTGKEMWSGLKDGGGMMGGSFSCPVFATVAGRDQVLVQSRTVLAGLDRASGKELWKTPIPADRGMNILTPTVVGDTVFTSSYGGGTRGVTVRKSEDGFRTEEAFSFKYQGYMSTPVIVAGHAYFLGRDQTVECVNIKDGKEAWRSDKRFGKYWSLVANGDKLLALDERGILYLIRANTKELEILAERKVADAESWAHLAVCGDELFVRDLNGLTAWKWK